MNNKKAYKHIAYTLSIVILLLFTMSIAKSGQNKENTVQTNAALQEIESLSNKKIGWGIKRSNNHTQPDVGTRNKEILDKYDGYCLGSNNSKKVYLTFDEGYEAGYTEKILAVLKENEVKATFFITAHYVNTQPELVQKMINEGHIIGNHTPKFLMSGIEKI